MHDAKELAGIAIRALEDKKAINLRVIGIDHISTLADYFIIASGSNKNQVQALADNVEEQMSRAGCEPKQIEGYRGASWVLLDYGDVVIHVFDEENRLFYDLERIWRDGRAVDPETLTEA